MSVRKDRTALIYIGFPNGKGFLCSQSRHAQASFQGVLAKIPLALCLGIA